MPPVTLVCPVSKVALRRTDVDEADAASGALVAPDMTGHRPVGRTQQVELRADGGGAYPVLRGIPVVLVPEMLSPLRGHEVDVTVAPYEEAYSELEHYSSSAAEEAEQVDSSSALAHLRAVRSGPARHAFPEPPEPWLDMKYDMPAQVDAFRHLSPIDGAAVLQLGGRGLQAVKMLLAGAREAWVATPMVGELLYAVALAEAVGVADRLHCVAALAEELPFPDRSFDAVYAQGSVHHWVVDRALPECARVLVDGGRFAAVEPWRGPLYGIGTGILGKRDRGVQCVVLTPSRIRPPLAQSFPGARIVHHGVLSRYALLALKKARISFSHRTVWRLSTLDDRLVSRSARLRDQGSSVAILATAGSRPSDAGDRRVRGASR